MILRQNCCVLTLGQSRTQELEARDTLAGSRRATEDVRATGDEATKLLIDRRDARANKNRPLPQIGGHVAQSLMSRR